MPIDRRLVLSPVGRALVVVPDSLDRIELHHFDLDTELARLDRDYFFISSLAPTIVPPDIYEYQIEAKSKRGGLTFRIESGPPGMTVSATGLVSWRDVKLVTDTSPIVVSVTDTSGRTLTQDFRFPGSATSVVAGMQTAAQQPESGPLRVMLVPKSEPNAVAETPLRKWTSVDGTYTVMAALLAVEGDEIKLRKEDGKEVELPLAKLSEADQKFVRDGRPAAKPK